MIIPPAHSGKIRFTADTVYQLSVNGVSVEDDYPVGGYGNFVPNLSSYLIIPGVNSFTINIRDGGNIHNFDIEFGPNAKSPIVFIVKMLCFFLLVFYGLWRLRQTS